MFGITKIEGHQVVWHGESLGMYLKEDPDQDYCALALCYRVMVSPFGYGFGAVILGDPNTPMGWPHKPNFVITNNFPLMRWLVDNWVSRIPCFKGKPGFENMTWKTLQLATKRPLNYYEPYVLTIKGNGINVVLTWDEVNETLSTSAPGENNFNGEFDLLTVLIEMKNATIEIDGHRLPGKPVTCVDVVKDPMRSAFLGYVETWLESDELDDDEIDYDDDDDDDDDDY